MVLGANSGISYFVVSKSTTFPVWACVKYHMQSLCHSPLTLNFNVKREKIEKSNI